MTKVENSSEMLQRMGTDGSKWAEEFIKMWSEKKQDIDEDLMLGWFCNSIMAGYDKGFDEGFRKGCGNE